MHVGKGVGGKPLLLGRKHEYERDPIFRDAEFTRGEEEWRLEDWTKTKRKNVKIGKFDRWRIENCLSRIKFC